MGSTVSKAVAAPQRVVPEIDRKPLKARLRNTESDDYLEEIGRCLEFARRLNGWTLDELAGKLPPPPGADARDPRQVQRWIEGKERCQVDVVFAVEALRVPFVVALARLAKLEPDMRIPVPGFFASLTT